MMRLLTRRRAALLAALVFPSAVACAGEVSQCTLPTDGLVAWYSGDGSTADSTAAANNGTYHGGASYSVAAKVGFAFALNGSTDYVSAPSTAAIDPTSAGSEAAWVKFDTLPSVAGHIMEIIGKGGSGTDFDLQAETDNKFRFFIAGGNKVSSTTTIQAGVYYHVVGTWDSTGDIRLYVNGNLEDVNPVQISRSASGQELEIGNQPYFGPRLFAGNIDEARIYDRALGEEEVAAHVCTGFCGDANGDGTIKASDALRVLRAAVGPAIACPLWRCDTDDSAALVASDALRVLRYAVGQAVTLNCPLP